MFPCVRVGRELCRRSRCRWAWRSDRTAAGARAARCRDSRRPADSKPSSRPAWPAAGLPVVVVNPAQVRAFAQALGQAGQDRPARCRVIAHFAEATKPQCRVLLPDETTRLLADLIARRRQIVEMMVAERQRAEADDRTAAAEEHCPAASPPCRRSSGRDRRRHRRSRAWLAGLGREGRLARLRPRRRHVRRPYSHRRTARVRARSTAARSRRSPALRPGPASPASGAARASSAAAARPSARPCSWPPWSPLVTTRCSKAFRDKLVAAGKPKRVALIAVARKLLTILNAIVRDKRQWHPETA